MTKTILFELNINRTNPIRRIGGINPIVIDPQDSVARHIAFSIGSCETFIDHCTLYYQVPLAKQPIIFGAGYENFRINQETFLSSGR